MRRVRLNAITISFSEEKRTPFLRNPITSRDAGKGDTVSKHLSLTSVTAFILIGAVVILSGTTAGTAQQYQVGTFPITPLQMKVLQPSATIREEQSLSRQPTMNASRAGVRDFSIAGQSG